MLCIWCDKLKGDCAVAKIFEGMFVKHSLPGGLQWVTPLGARHMHAYGLANT